MPRITRETTVEKALKKTAEAEGGYCIKLTGYKGIPDRLIVLPGAIVAFAETKTLDGKLGTAQKIWRRWIEGLGLPWAAPRTSAEATAYVHGLLQQGEDHD